jgi:hypothetical protein
MFIIDLRSLEPITTFHPPQAATDGRRMVLVSRPALSRDRHTFLPRWHFRRAFMRHDLSAWFRNARSIAPIANNNPKSNGPVSLESKSRLRRPSGMTLLHGQVLLFVAL